MQDGNEVGTPGNFGVAPVQNQAGPIGGVATGPGGVDVTMKGLWQTGPATMLGSGVSVHASHQNDESVQLALQRIQQLHNMSQQQLQSNLNMKAT